MQNLAESGCVCECGEKRLVPRGEIKEVGSVVLCPRCARVYRVELVQARWSDAVLALEGDVHELEAFEWTRRGVPLERRRTLAELAESAPSRAAERSGVVLVAVLALLLVLIVMRAAVHS